MIKLEDLQDKIINNEQIKEFQNIFGSTYSIYQLTGGAIVDILEDRVPKDWDFLNSSGLKEKLLSVGFTFDYESAYSTTYKKDKIIAQVLKTSLTQFDFTISKAIFDFRHKKLSIDLMSFETKKLIPNNFTDKKKIIESLSRVPHWNKKGYTLPNQTYYSLLCKLYEDCGGGKLIKKS